eukprot:2934386-Rhodomonas_salina.1
MSWQSRKSPPRSLPLVYGSPLPIRRPLVLYNCIRIVKLTQGIQNTKVGRDWSEEGIAVTARSVGLGGLVAMDEERRQVDCDVGIRWRGGVRG